MAIAWLTLWTLAPNLHARGHRRGAIPKREKPSGSQENEQNNQASEEAREARSNEAAWTVHKLGEAKGPPAKAAALFLLRPEGGETHLPDLRAKPAPDPACRLPGERVALS